MDIRDDKRDREGVRKHGFEIMLRIAKTAKQWSDPGLIMSMYNIVLDSSVGTPKASLAGSARLLTESYNSLCIVLDSSVGRARGC